MIIFDRFLCCVNLKTFGKFLGWTGTMVSCVIAYTFFLIGTARKNDPESFHYSVFGLSVTKQEVQVTCVACIIIGCLHVLLVYGIKFGKRLAILPYVLVPLITTAAVICLGPSLFNIPAWDDEKQGPIVIAAYVIAVIFSVYLTLCIYSLYEIVKEEEKRKKFYSRCESFRA